MDIQIDTQNTGVDDDIRDMISARLEKLNTHHNDIIHARVSLVKSLRHQQGSDEARIFLSLTRRKSIQAAKMGKTLEDAVQNALDALQREVMAYRSKRRSLDKQRLKTAKLGPRLFGKVADVYPDQGYGFVDIGGDEEVRFSRQAIVGDSFDALGPGTPVEVDVIEAGHGYEATRVVPLTG